MLLRKKKASSAVSTSDRRTVWMNELSEIKKLLENNDRFFNMTSDFDLIEYAIHEHNALLMRYRFLLRQIRALDAGIESLPEPMIPAVLTA